MSTIGGRQSTTWVHIHHRWVGTTAAAVRGDLSYPYRDELFAELRALFTPETTTVELDLSEVSFCDAAALGCLVAVQKWAGRSACKLVITAASAQLAWLLALTGMTEFFHYQAEPAPVPPPRHGGRRDENDLGSPAPSTAHRASTRHASSPGAT
jgi:anti-anti-sigma factor